MERTMDENLNNFFSRGDLGGVNPELMECELKLYNVKEKYKILQAKVLMFYHELEKADCSAHGSVGIDGNYIQEYYRKFFDIQISNHGTTE